MSGNQYCARENRALKEWINEKEIEIHWPRQNKPTQAIMPKICLNFWVERILREGRETKVKVIKVLNQNKDEPHV